MFGYNPDKAKLLLSEAGYPDGFKTSIITGLEDVERLSIVKDYWAKVGVDLELQVKEAGAYTASGYGRLYTDMYMHYGTPTLAYDFLKLQGGLIGNWGGVDDPKINEAWEKTNAAYFDFAERGRIYKPLVPYILEQAYVLPLPGQWFYQFWQPWVKNYHGEVQVGYITLYDFCKYVCIDQDLKAEMTGKR